MKKHDRFLMAAIAGISMGVHAPAHGEEKKDEVKCYGVNGCGSHAKCSVSAEDLRAFRAFFGEQEYAAKYGKSEAHSCGSHAKCGASSGILNWVPATRAECSTQGGFVVEEVGKKKVAKKA